MDQLHRWLEANAEVSLAGAGFVAICLFAFCATSKIVSISRIRRLHHKISRLEKELADARIMTGNRLAERINARAVKSTPEYQPDVTLQARPSADASDAK